MQRGEQGSAQQSRAVAAAQEARRKAQFLQRKSFVEQTEIYALAKTFFKSYIGKDREFTVPELEHEMHRVFLSRPVRERLDALLQLLAPLEYSDKQYTQAEVKTMLQEFEHIVQDLVIEQKRTLPPLTRLANWLFRKKEKPKQTIISEYPVIEMNDAATVEINTILEELYAALDAGKHAKAVKLYKQLIRRYDSLGTSAQHGFFHKVNAAYEAIAKQAR